MDIVSVALKRYSTKAFDATKKLTAGEAEQLKTLLQYSPSSTNSQPWHFIVVDEPEAHDKLAEAFDDNGLTGCPWGDRVPAYIMIVEEEAHLMPGVGERYGSQHFAQMDIGMAAMGLCYEATALGLGTCMIGTMNQEKLHQAFEIPEERIVRLIITVGYPAKKSEPRKKARKDLEEIVSYNHW